MKQEIILNYIIMIIAIFIVITVHEFSKGFASYKFGDSTPKNEGRLTLNPLKHFEPIGFILILFWGYGWGKPVRTSSFYYNDRKKYTALTYTIPILVDLVLAIVFVIIMKVCMLFNNTHILQLLIQYVILYSIKMAVFNLIPVYPLCGNKILSVLISPDKFIAISQNEKIFQMILMLLLFMNWLGTILDPISLSIYRLFTVIL